MQVFLKALIRLGPSSIASCGVICPPDCPLGRLVPFSQFFRCVASAKMAGAFDATPAHNVELTLSDLQLCLWRVPALPGGMSTQERLVIRDGSLYLRNLLF